MAKWLINTSHSAAEFNVRHMMVSWVHGMFTGVTGTLDFDPLDVAAATVEVAIDATTLYTGVEKRDQHLKSADFFEVDRYPAMHFKSTRVEPVALDQAWVHGDLTIRGLTRPVVLDVHWTGPAHFNDEGTIYTSFGFRAETRVNREDFGMTFNLEMEHGGWMVSRQAYLILNLEVDLADQPRE